MHRPIYIHNGEHLNAHIPTLPSRWQGEVDCVVGPFSCKTVAEHFMLVSTTYNQYDAIMDQIFAKGDSWYVQVKPLALPA